MKRPKEQPGLTNRRHETILTNTHVSFTFESPPCSSPRQIRVLLCKCGISSAVSRSYLLGEPPRPQEESQEAADGDGQHREDEQTIPFTNILDPSEDCIQGHRHAVLPALWRRISIPWGENPLAPLVRVHGSGSG